MAAKLVIVGGGQMGEAIVGGLLAAGWADAAELAVVEVMGERRAELAARYRGVEVAPDVVPGAGVVLAVKPQVAEGACRALEAAGFPRALSIMAGVGVADLEKWLGPATAVVRAMPNTPALVGAGVTAIAGGTRATDDDLTWAEEVLSAVGRVVRVPESQLDAVTGLSGSGPAYVFLVAEAMVDAGVLAGLPRAVAEELASHTLLGAARLLTESGRSPAELRAAVTSPGGTTAAGLQALEERAVRAAFSAAVTAAAERSRQLGA